MRHSSPINFKYNIVLNTIGISDLKKQEESNNDPHNYDDEDILIIGS